MIVDLFVLPGLCFQSLSTFYRSLVYGLCVWNTIQKDKMYCRIKVWPLVWARSVKVCKTCSTLISDPLLPNSAPRNTVKPKLFCFHIGIHPCLIFLPTYEPHHSRWVAGTMREGLTKIRPGNVIVSICGGHRPLSFGLGRNTCFARQFSETGKLWLSTPAETLST